MTDLIHVQDLRIRRGSFELHVPTWALPRGQVVGLVGPNGAGKTTLLQSLVGLRPTDAGEARVFGCDPWADPVTVRSSLGFMADDMPLQFMRIGPLLRLLSGYYPSWDAELADRLLVLDQGRVVQEGPTDALVGDDRTLEEALEAWGAAGCGRGWPRGRSWHSCPP